MTWGRSGSQRRAWHKNSKLEIPETALPPPVLAGGIVIATLNGLRTLNAIDGLHAPSLHPTAHQGEMPKGGTGYPWYGGN